MFNQCVKFIVTLAWLFSSFSLIAGSTDITALLAKHDTYSNVKIAPDGKHLAVVVRLENKRALLFIQLDGFKPAGQIRFPGDIEVGDYHWVNNERVVISLAEASPWDAEPKFYGELYAVNYTGKKGEMIFGFRVDESTNFSRIRSKEAKRAWGEVIDTLQDDDDNILISSTQWTVRGEHHSELLLLNTYTGRSKKIAVSPAPNSQILTNSKGEIRAAVVLTEDYSSELYYYDQKKWHQIPSDKFGERLTAIAVNNSDDGLIILDQFNARQQGLSELKFKDASRRLIYRDPVVEVSSVALTQLERQAYALRVDDGKPAYLILEGQQKEAQIFKELVAALPGSAVHITSRTDDDNIWVVFSYSDDHAGTYYLYRKDKNSLVELMQRKPELSHIRFAKTEPVQFSSSDQTKVHGYITRAAKADSTSMVVLVHGGPHGIRDYWGFDNEVQLLSQAGFNVLQVNYRGSGGYGADFLKAGYRQWGGAVQQDIIAGTRWAISQGYAEQGKICIMGTSFGGYSAVQSAAIEPDLFSCAVAVSGVYELNLMKTDGDVPLRSFGISYLDEVLGTDPQELKLFSPVHRVATLKAPLLLAHGKKDKRAPMSQAEALREALDKHNKTYKWLEFDNERHGFYDPENRQRYFEQVTQFIRQHTH